MDNWKEQTTATFSPRIERIIKGLELLRLLEQPKKKKNKHK